MDFLVSALNPPRLHNAVAFLIPGGLAIAAFGPCCAFEYVEHSMLIQHTDDTSIDFRRKQPIPGRLSQLCKYHLFKLSKCHPFR